MINQTDLQTIQNNAGLGAGFIGSLNSTPSSWIGMSLRYIYGAAGIILLLNVISSGLKMMTSKGDAKVMQAAQSKLTTSAIGILILFVSYWIVQIVMTFLGINTRLFVN